VIRQVIDVGLTGRHQRWPGRPGDRRGGALRALVTSGSATCPSGSRRVTYDVRNDLYDRIQRLPFGYHDHAQTGQLMSRFIEDLSNIQRFLGFGVGELINVGLLFAGIVTLLISLNLRLALLALIPLVFLALYTVRFGLTITPRFVDVQDALGMLSSRLQRA
jgi:ATP-binding cassette subfamily B protein